MPRETRYHLDEMPKDSTLVPRRLEKEEFGRRLWKLMRARGWNQSELARQADLPRDSVSVYVRGKSLPSAKSLSRLAEALDTTPGDLLPNTIADPISEDQPSIDMRVSPGAPHVAWLQVNRLVSTATAVKVVELVTADRVHEASNTD